MAALTEFAYMLFSSPSIAVPCREISVSVTRDGERCDPGTSRSR
ncbi:hypothetical protein [Lentzea sp. HUAS12]|nr:hypothetical protein [Lentzea sp. HUAS12]